MTFKLYCETILLALMILEILALFIFTAFSSIRVFDKSKNPLNNDKNNQNES
jgi:hypothetical protein